MGPLTRLAFIGAACLLLLLGGLAVRGCYRFIFSPKAAPAPVSVQPPAQPDPAVEVQEWADPITSLAALTDFQKLATLNPQSRAVNPRVKKILYWMFVAEQKGIPPEKAIDRAFGENGNAGSRKAAGAKAQTMANFRTAKLWGLFASEVLPKLKRGEAVTIKMPAFLNRVPPLFWLQHFAAKSDSWKMKSRPCIATPRAALGAR